MMTRVTETEKGVSCNFMYQVFVKQGELTKGIGKISKQLRGEHKETSDTVYIFYFFQLFGEVCGEHLVFFNVLLNVLGQ